MANAKKMVCAYCGRLLTWDRDNFPSWLYAKCSLCIDGVSLPDGTPPPRFSPWRALVGFFRKTTEPKSDR